MNTPHTGTPENKGPQDRQNNRLRRSGGSRSHGRPSGGGQRNRGQGTTQGRRSGRNAQATIHSRDTHPVRSSNRSMRKDQPLGSEITLKLPPVEDNIRIIHLGGVEEVGRNMSMVEIGNDIVIIDMGIQFSEDRTPGVDFILPNTAYLEANKDRIRGVLITHGHLDHIGAIPYIMPKIGNPPIYTRAFTSLMIKKRQEEFPHLSPLDIRLVETNDVIRLGDLRIKPFAVTHAIPDAMGIIIETPYGDVVHTGDLRLNHVDGEPSIEEIEVYETFKNRKTLVLMADSTNAENPGFSVSEKVVYQNIEKIVMESKGRLIISTFASQVERMMKMLEIAERHGRKVVIDGRSVRTNLEVCRVAGLLKASDSLFIPPEDMTKYPENKIIALVTGAQGEEYSVLDRVAKKTHKYVRLSNRDTILMSSSVIPGNEGNVQRLKDNLSRQGAHLITYQTSDIHSSGHANAEELAWIQNQIKPKFFIPVHGYHYLLRSNGDIASQKAGVKEENVVIPDNGMVIEIQEKGEKIKILKEHVPSNILVVDGFSVSEMQDVVIRDRQVLAQDGIFVIVVSVDLKTKKLKKSPDIISRGFIYLRESQDLLNEARGLIKKTVEESVDTGAGINFDFAKERVEDTLSRFLLQRTAKRPIVIPVILGF